jgi:hypothetical protein
MCRRRNSPQTLRHCEKQPVIAEFEAILRSCDPGSYRLVLLGTPAGFQQNCLDPLEDRSGGGAAMHPQTINLRLAAEVARQSSGYQCRSEPISAEAEATSCLQAMKGPDRSADRHFQGMLRRSEFCLGPVGIPSGTPSPRCSRRMGKISKQCRSCYGMPTSR